MGFYTELIFGAELKHDTPPEVIEKVKSMIADEEEDQPGYWRNPLHGTHSTSFPASFVHGQIKENDIHELIPVTWSVSARCCLKNYESDIEKFLEWIKPYIKSGSGLRGMYAIVINEEMKEPKIYYLREPDEV